MVRVKTKMLKEMIYYLLITFYPILCTMVFVTSYYQKNLLNLIFSGIMLILSWAYISKELYELNN